MDMLEEIYRLVKMLPKEETYALSDQMRRCAVSIPSNIAEGHGRYSLKEFIKFLAIARGSNSELNTQLKIGLRVGYFTTEDVDRALKLNYEVGKMLSSLMLKMGKSVG